MPLALEMDHTVILDQLETLHRSDHAGIVEYKGAFYKWVSFFSFFLLSPSPAASC